LIVAFIFCRGISAGIFLLIQSMYHG
jgi:hypothetical protein